LPRPEVISGDTDKYKWRSQPDLLRLKTYIVADRLGAQELLRAGTNNFLDIHVDNAPWYQSAIYAFENTPAGRLVVHICS
jgi:hypothetical protein